MDYEKELETVKSGGNYWKPEVGKFKVKALSELTPTEPFIKKHDDEPEERIEQFMLIVLVDGQEKTWTFGKGKTPASTYGQLVELAVSNNNTLVDLEFTVIIKSDGTKKNFTIVD